MLIVYYISIIALTVATAYTFSHQSFITPLFGKICEAFLFFSIGVFHTWWIQKVLNSIVFPGSLIFSLILSVTVFLAQVLFLQSANASAIMSFAFTCAFLLPYSIYQSWLSFIGIPEKEYQLWYVPETLADQRVMVYLNSIPVQLKLSKHYFDPHDQTFQVVAPCQASFGRVFNQFVVEHNNDKRVTVKIENSDTHKMHYGWIFFLEGFNGLFKKRIDPQLSLLDNGIKENAVIIAERVYIARPINVAEKAAKTLPKKIKK